MLTYFRRYYKVFDDTLTQIGARPLLALVPYTSAVIALTGNKEYETFKLLFTFCETLTLRQRSLSNAIWLEIRRWLSSVLLNLRHEVFGGSIIEAII